MSGLMPCPKCGSTNLCRKAFWDPFRKDRTLWQLVCEDCGFLGPCGTDVDDANELWNEQGGFGNASV